MKARARIGAALGGALVAVVVAFAADAARAQQLGGNCSNTSTGLVPLCDLGAGAYKEYGGGLYPDGTNVPVGPYFAEGLYRAGLIRPLDRNGKPTADGRIVLLSIGMSNTTQEYSEFKRVADAYAAKNPRLLIVDGAQGGQDAEKIKDAAAPFWTNVAQRLGNAGVSAAQVQAVWLKQAIAGITGVFPADALKLEADLAIIVGILERSFPNLQIVYLSSRTYAGYATTALNPEPYAYQSGFSVQWLIADRMANPASGAWLAWGPYLWTDGTRGRGDGFVWECRDAQTDGTHPSPTSGVQKVAGLLLDFFTTDPTARPWFVAPGALPHVHRRLR